METILSRGEVAGRERNRIRLVGSLGGQFVGCAICVLRVTDSDMPGALVPREKPLH